jgi:signal recognition particle subunit SRP54
LGQVAGKQAREFDKAVKISGVILTKMDGSGKGGGALSASSAANARVMFIGNRGEAQQHRAVRLNKFIGSLLGIPDIASLIEHVQNAVKESNMKPEEMEAEELNFETFYSQLKAMGNMGPLKEHIRDDGRSRCAKGHAGAGRGEAEEIQGDNRINDKGGAQERKASSRFKRGLQG